MLSSALTVFDWIAQAGIAAVGVALCAIAALTVVVGGGAALSGALGGAIGGAERFTRAKTALETLGDGALDGAPLALAAGLLGGFALRYVQSLLGVGRYIFWVGASAGLALGVACGLLAGFALFRLARSPGWQIGIGALCGLTLGLIAFVIVFGRGAGYFDVGPEVGVTFGVPGLLGGALVGALLSERGSRPAGASTQISSRRRPWLRTLLGGVIGGFVLAGVALLLQRASLAQPEGPLFILPGIQPNFPLQGDLFLGALYGVGLCAVVGAVTGALLGATSMATSGWLRATGLAVALTLGGFFGLSLSLINGALVGPLFTIAPITTPIIYDPVATAHGLAGGALIGAILGGGCALLLRWAERRATSRWAVVAGVLLLLGVGVLLAHSWFHPLFGVDLL